MATARCAQTLVLLTSNLDTIALMVVIRPSAAWPRGKSSAKSMPWAASWAKPSTPRPFNSACSTQQRPRHARPPCPGRPPAYQEEIKRRLESQPGLTCGRKPSLISSSNRCQAWAPLPARPSASPRGPSMRLYRAQAVVLCAGTFMQGCCTSARPRFRADGWASRPTPACSCAGRFGLYHRAGSKPERRQGSTPKRSISPRPNFSRATTTRSRFRS